MSSKHLVFNNLGSSLVNSISAGQTSFDVVDPVFVDPGNDFYTVTAENVSSGAVEIMKVVGAAGATLTVERGAEGTSPSTFNAGDSVQVRTTAGLLDRLGQKSELGKQFPFQTTVVTGLLTLYVDPTGSDVTGDGSSGNPWATPYKAVEELQFISFGLAGSATVSFAAGSYTMDAQLVFNHPQGDRITFTSGATFQPITGMPIANYLSNRTSPTVPGRGANEFHNTCGTVGTLVSAATRATNRSNDAANNRTLLKSLNGCVFEWGSPGADEPKFVVSTALGGFSNIALVFPPADFVTPSLRVGVDIRPGAVFRAGDLNITAGDIGLRNNAGQLVCTSVAIAGARAGIELEHNAVLTATNIFVQGPSGIGLELETGASMSVEGTYQVSGAATNGILVGDSSSIRVLGDGQRYDSSGNEGNGLAVVDGASVEGLANTTIYATGNTSSGFFVARGAIIRGDTLSPAGNEGSGVSIRDMGIIKSTGSHGGDNNGVYGADVSGGALLSAVSLTASFNDNSGLRVSDGGMLQTNSVFIVNNGGRAGEFRYSGACRFTSAFINTTNAASPHMLGIGQSVVFCPGPGEDSVSGSVVFSPTHGTLSPTGTVFTTESSF